MERPNNEEASAAIKEVNCRISPGEYNIPNELIKAAGAALWR